MAQVTALHPHGTPGAPYSFSAKTAAVVTWTSAGYPYHEWLFTAANWISNSFVIEAMMKATAGTARMRLYDITGTAAVTGSETTTDLGSYDRIRSGALTLVGGHEYRIQFGSDAASSGAAYGAGLINT